MACISSQSVASPVWHQQKSHVFICVNPWMVLFAAVRKKGNEDMRFHTMLKLMMYLETNGGLLAKVKAIEVR
jgi:hypothetical protein